MSEMPDIQWINLLLTHIREWYYYKLIQVAKVILDIDRNIKLSNSISSI